MSNRLDKTDRCPWCEGVNAGRGEPQVPKHNPTHQNVNPLTPSTNVSSTKVLSTPDFYDALMLLTPQLVTDCERKMDAGEAIIRSIYIMFDIGRCQNRKLGTNSFVNHYIYSIQVNELLLKWGIYIIAFYLDKWKHSQR